MGGKIFLLFHCDFKRCKLILCLSAALGILGLSPPAFPELSLELQKVRLEERITQSLQRESEARKVLDRARDVLSRAERLNDQRAADISRQAIRLSEEALYKIRKSLTVDEARLEAVEKALRLDSKSHLAFASKLKGDVSRKTKEGSVKFEKDTPLVPGEEVQTGADGFAEITLTDGSIIKMGPNTTFKAAMLEVEQSIYDVMGRIHAQMECLKKARDVCRKVRIPTGGAVLAVRGTEFEIDAPLKGPATITVIDGLVEMIAPQKEGSVEVRTGERVVIQENGSVERPFKVNLGSVKGWWMEE